MLGDHDAQRRPLTLAKLRTVLEAISNSVIANQGRSPSISNTAKIMRDNGVEYLPLETIATLVEAVLSSSHKDVLSAFSLKELEELMSRVPH
jgi:hypothetical protein